MILIAILSFAFILEEALLLDSYSKFKSTEIQTNRNVNNEEESAIEMIEVK